MNPHAIHMQSWYHNAIREHTAREYRTRVYMERGRPRAVLCTPIPGMPWDSDLTYTIEKIHLRSYNSHNPSAIIIILLQLKELEVVLHSQHSRP